MKHTTDLSYRRRVDAAIAYIRSNPGADLSLNTLADVASFSSFHFHRIFKAMTGEPLGQYIQRTRMESAAMALRSNLNLSVVEVALQYGYESPDGFSRAFRKVFGLSPKDWDRDRPLQKRKIGREPDAFPVYDQTALCDWADTYGWTPEVVTLPAMNVARLQVTDAYRNIDGLMAAYDRLWPWYESTLAQREGALFLGCSHDDPDLTPLERCTFEWAAGPVKSGEVPEGISVAQLPEQSVVRIRLQGTLEQEDQIWQYLYRVWLPQSAYEPAHAPAMELYCEPPHTTQWQTYDLWCALPVVPVNAGLA